MENLSKFRLSLSIKPTLTFPFAESAQLLLASTMGHGAVIVAGIAILIGIFGMTTIPTKLGFYRLLATHVAPALVGFTPAFQYGIPWKYTFEEHSKSDLTGQTAIVTGANSGIGYEIALALARQGAQVTMLCRNPSRCQKAAMNIQTDKSVKGSVIVALMDTSSLGSVRSFAEMYLKANRNEPLDMLFLNAGGIFSDMRQKCVPLTDDGIESVFASNYLGHHLLYRLLEPMLQRSKLARVINTSSMASFSSYSYKVATDLKTLNGCSEHFAPITPILNKSYGQSKLAQVLWVKALTKRLGSSSTIYANAFHPGLVDTEIFTTLEQPSRFDFGRNIMNWVRSEIMWRAADGALTGLFLGVAVDRLVKDSIRGKYFHPQAHEVPHPLAEDEKLQNDLWEFSEELIQNFLVLDKDIEVSHKVDATLNSTESSPEQQEILESSQ